jgi:hypothetical protein
MDFLDEIKAHQRMKGENGKVGSRKAELPNEFQKNLIKKVERDHPLGGFTRIVGGKVFGIACQSVIRVLKRIQNSARQWHQTFLTQVLCWGNIDPTTKWRQLRGQLPISTLGRCPRHSRGEVVTSRGKSQ